MIPYTEDLVAVAGLTERCAAIRAVSLPPIADAPATSDEVITALAAETERAHVERRADLVILGGSRLSPYAAELRRRVAIAIIEPFACAIQTAEALVRLGLRQSKVGKFAPPHRPLAEYDA